MRYWPGPEDPDGLMEKDYKAYKSTIHVKFISKKEEAGCIIREMEVGRTYDDGRVNILKLPTLP